MSLGSALSKLYKISQPKPWPLEKPVVVQFPVNDICNSRCQMCNIWQKKLDYQITPEDLDTAVRNPLFSDVHTVGVNGGEPTLRKDLADLVDVLYKRLPSLTTISLITNAYQDQVVIQRIEEIGQVIQAHDGNLNVMVSLDGVGEVHDGVRGKPGNFERAVKVIDYVQSSDQISRARLGCTVIRENVYGLHDLLEFALSKDIYIKYRIGIPHQRLYSQDVVPPFALTFEERYHFAIFLENLIKFYETSPGQKFFYRSLIDQFMKGKPRAAGCDWQHRGVTLSARGELLYCAVESKTLGSAITQDAEDLYFSNSEHLGDIVRTKCDSCMHDYVGLPSRSALLRTYRDRVVKRFPVPSQLGDNEAANRARYLRKKRRLDNRFESLGVKTKSLPTLKPASRFPRRETDHPKVLICGWYGTETLGDKAILGGVVTAIEANFDTVSFHLASLESYISEMTVRQMPDLENCTVHSIPAALDMVGSMDLVVVGGGPLMAIDELAEILAIFQRAAEAGIPTMIAGCGVGPLNLSFQNEAVGAILALSSCRIFRDQKSLQLAQELGIDTTADLVAEDPAFTWLQQTIKKNPAPENSKHGDQDQKLLLGLRDWPSNQYAPDLHPDEARKLKVHFEGEVNRALELLLDQYPNLTIVPFPMCTNHIGGDDRWFYRRLFRNNRKILAALDQRYLGAEVTPSEAVELFQTASAALTMRYHSLIFALACGLPAVSIDYTLGEGKVHSLAERFDVPQIGLDEVNHQSIYEMLSAALTSKQISSVFDVDAVKFTDDVSSCVSALSNG